jgi:hypothetical protein
MSVAKSMPLDSDKAREIWAQYQREHDVSDRIGQAVGVDPVSGRIWFGRKALDIARQMRAEGIDRPFYCVRVGADYYGRKGGRR